MKTAVRLLLLEDNSLDAELIVGLLNEGGFECRSHRVETRADFIAALERDPFDVILADYSLPSFDGLSALQIARERCPDVPFVLVSGVLGEDVAIEALTQGATDYVLKQRLTRLVPAVQRALTEERERRERKAAQESLARNEALLRAIIEGTTDAVFVKDRPGRYLMINTAGARAIGRTIADIIGKDDTELFPPDLGRKIMESDRRVMESAVTETFEETTRSWGAVRTYLATKGPIRDDAGNVVGMFGISRDITTRKREEERVREAEAKLRTIVEQLPVVTYVGQVEDPLTTLYVSPLLEPLLQFTEDDLDDPALWQHQIHPDDRGRVLAEYELTRTTGEPTASSYRFLAADGSELRFHDRRVLIRDEAGAAQFVQGVMLHLAAGYD